MDLLRSGIGPGRGCSDWCEDVWQGIDISRSAETGAERFHRDALNELSGTSTGACERVGAVFHIVNVITKHAD